MRDQAQRSHGIRRFLKGSRLKGVGLAFRFELCGNLLEELLMVSVEQIALAGCI